MQHPEPRPRTCRTPARGAALRARWPVAALWCVAALAAGCVLVLALVMLRRIAFPFELEWGEGAALDEVRLIAETGRLYPPPSPQFVPLIYNPLFFVVAAGVSKLLGVGFLAGRLVSALATLATLTLAARIVFTRTRSIAAGIVTAGLYAATFRLSGAWMDLAKADALLLLLVLAAFVVGDGASSRHRQLAAALLWALAFFAKQTALSIMLPLALVALATTRGRAWLEWVGAAVLGGAGFVLLDRMTGGWFSFYTFDVVADNQWATSMWTFWQLIGRSMWPALLLAAASLALQLRSRRGGAHRWTTPALIAALMLGSWSGFLQRWTYDNGLMPACLGLALAGGLACGQLLRLREQWQGWGATGAYGAALMLVVAQLALVRYDPWAQLPTADDRAAWASFVDQVGALPGEVLVFNHGFVTRRAGKAGGLHSGTYSDASGAGANAPDAADADQQARRLATQAMFERAVREQHWEWIVLDDAGERWAPYYLPDAARSAQLALPLPRTGAPSQPQRVLRRNPLVRGGRIALGNVEADAVLGQGWSQREAWGRWAEGRRATIQLSLEPEHPYALTLELRPLCAPGLGAQTVTVVVGGQVLRTAEIAPCTPQALQVSVPPQSAGVPPYTVELSFAETWTPRALSIADDDRALAMGMAAIDIVQQ